MLTSLRLEHVGPSSALHIDFAERLNLFTGDNGLGKSFLLDVVWWALTRQWPQGINPVISGGRKAIPAPGKKARIRYSVRPMSGNTKKFSSTYDADSEQWKIKSDDRESGDGRGRPVKPGLIIYAMVDGSFALWDPARNYWRNADKSTKPAFVFSPYELWNGQKIDGDTTCNGIIRDWAYWYKENGDDFAALKKVLEILSADLDETIKPGNLTRISVRDVQDIPTIRMPYTGDDDEGVPIIHASSAVKRIISMAYLLVWAWREHRRACETRNRISGGQTEKPASHITFIVDEIEAHLHPRWQRTIMRALYTAICSLTDNPQIQLLISTHSPLVMAGCEDFFDVERDRWFDIDRDGQDVVLRAEAFSPKGTAAAWLISPAFDMASIRSPRAERLIEEASQLLRSESATAEDLLRMKELIEKRFSSQDRFAATWFYLADKKLKELGV